LPEFVILRDAAPGFVLLPWVPLKVKTAGATDNWGVGTLMAKAMELDEAPLGGCTLTEAEPELAIKLAGTTAESCIPEPSVVVRAEPFQSTASPETKLLPLTVRVNVEPPAVALVGDSEVTIGAGALMAKAMELDEAPLGGCTLTEAKPELAIKLAGTAAKSCIAEPKVVARAEPFHSTASPETKLLPLTVRENAELPAIAPAGESEVTVGVGGGARGNTVSVTVTTPGEACAPTAVIFKCPVYVPAANPLTVAVTARFCGAVPEMGETPSHAASVAAVKFSVPPPVLFKLT
jgi:hypothetical protein